MAFIETFSTTDKGAMIFTGNTLGLTNNGVQIQTFTTLDGASQVAGFPPGTTTIWQDNGSSAELNIPAGATVLYAQLQWGGEYKNNVEDLSGVLNTPVTFTTPSGTTSVSPNPADSDIADLGGRGYYSNSQDVTSLIQAAGSGTYSVEGVPAAIGGNIATDGAGWTLGVVYQLDTLPFRIMTLYTGVAGILNNSPPIDIDLSGFATPASGPVEGRILISAVEGDFAGGGDQALFGPDTSSLVALSGPNNSATNFFMGQINNGDSESPNVGQLDTTGTFGNINYPTQNPARYGWDLTNVPITNLQNSQQQGVLRIQTTGDSYAVELIGIQIDVDAADLEVVKSVDKVVTSLGETLTYSIDVTNNGTVDSINTIITDTIPAGTTFVPNSVTIGGVAAPGENPENGINLGTISPGETVTITFQVNTNNLQTVTNDSSVDYTFIPAPGIDPVDKTTPSNEVNTEVTTPFVCDPVGFMVNVPVGSTNSSLSEINLITGDTTLINSDIGLNLNAIGYNTLDNFIYGIEDGTSNLVVMDVNGTTYNLGPVPNLPVSNYDVGAIDLNGYLYIRNSATDTYYVIDTNQGSPTFGQLVDPTAGFILDTAPFGTTLSNNLIFNDWSFSTDGNLYGVEGNGTVVRVDPLTGTVTELTTTGIPGGALYESAYSMSDGYLYVTNNATGEIYRIEINGNNADGLLFSTQDPVIQADGTSCLNAVLEIDFGDAPDISTTSQSQGDYKTLLASDGPRHGIVNNLRLGTQVTAEGDAYQSPDALGDDQVLGVQDDGTTLPLTNIALNATDYTITETVFNNTGSPANVYAWIDFNKDGIFQTEEGTTAVVPSSGAPQTVDLTFTVPGGTTLTPGDTFVRVRVTTDNLINTGQSNQEDTRSFGAASDGEVEDYLLTVEDTQIISTKSVDPAFADLGDTLTYTVTLTNPGTLPIDDVLFTDPLPNGVTYANNLSVNTAYTGTDPMTGLTITTINPGQTVTISWDVLIGDTLPNPNPITNVGTVTIPTLPPTTTPEVETQVNNANLTITKSADKETAIIGETITYTIEVTNSGNVDANPAVVTDLLPPSTTYVSGTLLVNGIANPADPTNGFDIGPVGPGETKTITFDVTVDENPSPLPLENTANVDYEYIVDPTQPPVSVTEPSNTVDIDVADIEIVKSVDKEYVQVGDTLTYTNVITNTGNAPIENVVFTDTPPTGTTYVSPSVSINGIVYPALNPNNPIDLESVVPSLFPLQPGSSITVSYRVSIDAIPDDPTITNTSSGEFEYTDGNETKTSNKDSNEVSSEVREGQVELTKTADKDVVEVGDILTYTIIAENTGNVEVSNVVITDIIPPETSFVEGSIIVGGEPRPNDNPADGINLGTIDVGDIVFVSFSVVINEFPTSGQISNTSSGSFIFIVDPNQPPVTETTNSNEVVTDVEELNISITKTCEPKQIIVGDEITYTFTINNSGTVDISNIKLFDTLANGLELVSGSFVGSNQGSVTEDDLIAGVDIGNLNAGDEKEVLFKVILTKQICPPVVCNKATITYEYELDEGQILKGMFESNECCIDIITTTFKQNFKDGNLSIPDVKPDMESLIDISITPYVTETEVVNSPKGISQSGQSLTGKKLLTYIKFCITITYVSESDEQSVHSAHVEVLTSDYIIIPEGGCEDCVNPYIQVEDIFYEMISNRKVFFNITYLLDICC